MNPTETARVSALRRLSILDTERESTFDIITTLLADLLSTPQACVSLVDNDRVWFKSTHGVSVAEVGKDPGFCVTLVESKDDVRYIRDASLDPATQGNPLVLGGPLIRFYAGVPLTTDEGHRIGTLCTFAPTPREFSDTEYETMRGLASLVMNEIQLRHTRSQLDRTEAALQASQRIEGIGLIASGVAHDFNNLLGGILGNAELLGIHIKDDGQAHELIDQIIATGRRASDLASQVLAYAGSKRETPFANVDLNNLVEETHQMLRGVLDDHLLVRFNLDPEIPLIHGQSTPIRQLVMNLMTNAAEACDQDRGLISISTTFTPGDVGPTLTVTDNGRGLAKAACDRIFEPFYTSKSDGRGLGLAICRRIVADHEGEIFLSSNLGEGTSISVVLPQSNSGSGNPRAVSKPKQVSSSQGLILIVDDEKAIRDVADRYLTAAGYATLPAAGGEQAIQFVNKHREEISAIVLDWSMPQVSGNDVMEFLAGANISTPVILASGHSEQETMSKLPTNIKVQSFLKKPYPLVELRNHIDTALVERSPR